jgi:hypothetical protein
MNLLRPIYKVALSSPVSSNEFAVSFYDSVKLKIAAVRRPTLLHNFLRLHLKMDSVVWRKWNNLKTGSRFKGYIIHFYTNTTILTKIRDRREERKKQAVNGQRSVWRHNSQM